MSIGVRLNIWKAMLNPLGNINTFLGGFPFV